MPHHNSKVMKRYNHLTGEINGIYHEMSLKTGLSDSAMSILYTILDSGATSCLLQDICRYSGISKQTINSAIRKLEAEGILYLTPVGPKNKKVCLTEEGIRLTQQTAGRVLAAENEIFDSWPKEDVEKYLELTEAFLLALQEKAKEF